MNTLTSCSLCTCLQRYVRKATPKYLKLRRGFKSGLPGIYQKIDMHIDDDQRNVWIEPEGYDSGINIYNSLSKSKVPFKLLNPGVVTWYNCGPTVYDSAHIGHALCFVKLDIIRRILEDIFQLNVVQVTGVTDIDEKIIRKAKELGIRSLVITGKYEKEFFEDMQKFNVRPPSVTPRVTQYIPHIYAFIEKLIDKGFAYTAEGSVYFDIAAYGRGTKFVRQKDDSTISRITPDKRKRNPHDFALWRESQDRDFSWESPWGTGIPGWHIECSAMASHIFGDKLDLHSGGVDLMFPHHENEETQCCALHDSAQWCNYWIHTGHLHASTVEKMSKSLHNTIGVDRFLAEHSSNLFRVFCLVTKYRAFVEYSPNTMNSARQTLKKLTSFLQDSQAYIRGSTGKGALDSPLLLKSFSHVKRNIRAALADDFDTKQAMTFLLEFITLCNVELHKRESVRFGRNAGTVAAIREYVQHFLTTMGMKFDRQELMDDEIVKEEKYLTNVLDSSLRFRQTVRDFALLKDNESSLLSKDDLRRMKQERAPLLKACDIMRDELAGVGIQVKDHSTVASWCIEQEKTDV